MNDNDTPVKFAAIKAVLWPMLQSRADLEIGIPSKSPTFDADFEIPHEVIAVHLAATFAYKAPQSKSGVNVEPFEQWGVSIQEALEAAKHNLREHTGPFSKVGGFYSFTSGDAFNASRLLLTDRIRDLNVAGDPIATVPHRTSLYVCGSEDTHSLQALAELTSDDLQHEQSISGMAFRLVGDEWKVWLPPVDHPTYDAFYALYLQTIGQAYTAQKDLLDRRHFREEATPFVATFMAIPNQQTGRQSSFCTWSEGVPTLLPETDLIFFSRPTAPAPERAIGWADWETVRNLVGDLMEPQGLYPERWLVREHPSASVLKQLRSMSDLPPGVGR